MLGDIVDLEHRPSDARGITPRVFEYLFSRIQKVRRRVFYTITLTLQFVGAMPRLNKE
jgi:hypothetical protein